VYYVSRKADELLQELVDIDLGISRRQLTRLRLISQLDREDVWEDNGYVDMIQWLSAHYKIGAYKAGRWLHAARSLDRLPLISTAFENGLVSEEQVLELCRFATPETEEELLGWAQRVTLGSLKNKADLACRPDPAETQQIDKERSIRYWFEEGGSRFGLAASLPAADGAKFAAKLDALAEKIPSLPTDLENAWGDRTRPESIEARRADALLLLVEEAQSGDGKPILDTVVVHTDLVDHLNGGGSSIEGGGVIPPAVTSRLLCDSKLQTVLSDGNNGVVGIGRADREVPTWLRRELDRRDGGCCTFPGCTFRRYLQAHHIIHWEHGGPTNLDNLLLVCGFHHKLVHDYGWSVRLRDDFAEWFRPNGVAFQVGPAPPIFAHNLSASPPLSGLFVGRQQPLGRVPA
jgi:hypothetical protein